MLLLLLSLLVHVSAAAQENTPQPLCDPPVVVWQTVFDLEGHPARTACAVATPDGGAILAGFAGYGEDPENAFSNLWMAKVQGTEVVWQKQWGQQKAYQGVTSILRRDDGSLVVGQYVISEEDPITVEWRVQALSENGEPGEEWKLGGFANGSGLDLSHADDSGFLAAGCSDGPDKLISLMFRLDSEGKVVWKRQYRKDAGYGTRGIRIEDGSYVLAGLWLESAFLVKTRPNGRVIWDKMLYPRGGPAQGPLFVRALPGGGLILLAAVESRAVGANVLWIARTDAEGSIIQSHLLDGLGSASPGALELLPSGEAVIAATCHNSETGNGDFFLGRLRVNGTLVWGMKYGTDLNEELDTMTVLSDGSYLLSGTIEVDGKTRTTLMRTDKDCQSADPPAIDPR